MDIQKLVKIQDSSAKELISAEIEKAIDFVESHEVKTKEYFLAQIYAEFNSYLTESINYESQGVLQTIRGDIDENISNWVGVYVQEFLNEYASNFLARVLVEILSPVCEPQIDIKGLDFYEDFYRRILNERSIIPEQEARQIVDLVEDNLKNAERFFSEEYMDNTVLSDFTDEGSVQKNCDWVYRITEAADECAQKIIEDADELAEDADLDINDVDW